FDADMTWNRVWPSTPAPTYAWATTLPRTDATSWPRANAPRACCFSNRSTTDSSGLTLATSSFRPGYIFRAVPASVARLGNPVVTAARRPVQVSGRGQASEYPFGERPVLVRGEICPGNDLSRGKDHRFQGVEGGSRSSADRRAGAAGSPSSPARSFRSRSRARRTARLP